jgi:ABC-type uncharacterized transport system ATPase subunit
LFLRKYGRTFKEPEVFGEKLGKLKLVVKVIAKIFVIFLVIFQANAKRNFDETIEAHVRLGIKKERTDQVRALGHMLAYFRRYLICVEFEWLELKLFVGLNC